MADATSRDNPRWVRSGTNLFRVVAVREGALEVTDADTHEPAVFPWPSDTTVPFRQVTSEEFAAAVIRVLTPRDLEGIKASGIGVAEQCVFVAKRAFLGRLAPEVREADLDIIRQTLWNLSEYDGTNGFAVRDFAN